MTLYNAFGDLRTQSPNVGSITPGTLANPSGSTLEISTTDCSGVMLYMRTGASATGVITIEGLIDPGDASSWAALSYVRVDSGPTLYVGAGPSYASSTGYRFRIDTNGLTKIRLRVTTTLGATLAALVYQKHIDAEPLFSVNVPSGTQAISGTITATLAGVAEQTESSTNLAGGASYTGASRDAGSTASTRTTLIRPMVMHTAGLTPGTLILQESTDAATWRETRRVPIPSDSSYRSFEWPLHMRYYRLVFTNGATAQTGFYLHAVRSQGEGGTMDSHNNLNFLLSTTALGASSTFTGPTLDLGDNHIWSDVFARVNLGTASTTSTIRIESSTDGTIWTSVAADTISTTAAGLFTIQRPVLARYLRLVVVNGATLQASNQFSMTLLSL